MNKIVFSPIGFVRTEAKDIPKHFSISSVRGELVLNEHYLHGLKDLYVGQDLVVIFYFHKSPPFREDLLEQRPPHREHPKGVFSICSPVRPNGIGLSVVEVIGIKNNVVEVNHIDMLDGTPILDLKPHKG